MPRISGIRRLFRFPSSDKSVTSDVRQEIAFHVQARTDELIASGLDPAAARARALREFGDVGAARAELEAIGRRRVRQTHRANWWQDLRQDLRYGLRALARAPVFTLLAVVTLALGIGANAAILSVSKSVLLDPLPYGDPDRLVRIHARWLDGSQARGPLSAAAIVDAAGREHSFERISAYVDSPADTVFSDGAGARLAAVGWVESSFFDTLGVAAARGRTFRAGDEASALVPLSGGQMGTDTAHAVLLTHGAWQRLFGADPAILGRAIHLGGLQRTVIGILPPRFIGPVGEVDFYLAFDLAPVLADANMARGAQWLGAIGRLTPGVSDEAAGRELATIGSELARAYPRDHADFTIAAMPLRDWLVGDTRTPLVVLMTSAAFVLLIACANMAGALLSRTLSRRQELAVRATLGASRTRLVRQLLTESVLLAAMGGAAAVALAWLLLSVLRRFAQDMLPAYADLSLDRDVLLTCALLALATGLAFGTAPAAFVHRADPQGGLRAETRGASEGRRARRLRGALVASQLALSISLLVGAGLLARSLWAMATTPLGFDARHVLTASVQLPAREYPTPAARVQFLDRLADRLRALPGVEAVADASAAPTRVASRVSFSIDGAPRRASDAQPFVLAAPVSGEYFGALRIPLRAGRTFDARDRAGAPPTVIISETMASRYWPAGDALGARIRTGPNPNAPLMEIVGIVGDVRNDRARPDAEPMLYRSSRQASRARMSILLRTQGDPLLALKPMEHELAALDRGLALERAMTLEMAADEGIASRRLPVALMTAFGVLALLLASAGLYAMFASMAAAREWEFALRMALGSRPAAICRLLLRQGGGWMAAGLAGGAVGIVGIVQLLRGRLYEVPAFDPIALGAAIGMLLASAAIALAIPLRRATSVDPARVLRQ